MSRILISDGALFVSVDIGGSPTPDEPTVFAVDSLRQLLEQDFNVVRLDDDYPPHSVVRVCSLRVLARRKPRASQPIDKAKILRAYEVRLADETDKSRKSA
jgi:hypothetical protein